MDQALYKVLILVVIALLQFCIGAPNRYIVDSSATCDVGGGGFTCDQLDTVIAAASNGDTIMLKDRGTPYSLGTTGNVVAKELMFISDLTIGMATISISSTTSISTNGNGKYVFQKLIFIAVAPQAEQIVETGAGNGQVYFMDCTISNVLASSHKNFLKHGADGENTIVVSYSKLTVLRTMTNGNDPNSGRRLKVSFTNNEIEVVDYIMLSHLSADEITFRKNKISGNRIRTYCLALIGTPKIILEDNELTQTGTVDSEVLRLLGWAEDLEVALRNNKITAAPQSRPAMFLHTSSDRIRLYSSNNIWDFNIANGKATGVIDFDGESISAYVSDEIIQNLAAGSSYAQIVLRGTSQSCAIFNKITCVKGDVNQPCFYTNNPNLELKILQSTFSETTNAITIENAKYDGTKSDVPLSLVEDNPGLNPAHIGSTSGSSVGSFSTFCQTYGQALLSSYTLAHANDDTTNHIASTTTTVNVRANDEKDVAGNDGTLSAVPIGRSYAGYAVAMSGSDEITYKEESLTPLNIGTDDFFYYLSHDPQGGIDVAKVTVLAKPPFAYISIGELNAGLKLYSPVQIDWDTGFTSSSFKLTLDLYTEAKVKVINLVENYDVTAKKAMVVAHRANPLNKYLIRAEVNSVVVWSDPIVVRVCNTFNLSRVQVCKP